MSENTDNAEGLGPSQAAQQKSKLHFDRQTLNWALMRLGQIQGGKLDPVRMKEGLELEAVTQNPLDGLLAICRLLDKPKPRILKKPERVHVPMLAHHAQWGWGILVDQQAAGTWVLQTTQGPKLVQETSVQRRCAMVQLGPKINLGFGLFASPKEPLGFFSHVRSTLIQYRPEILESAVASFFIGMLALVTSMFSMQVYDRVIPTRGEHTLVVLAIGVLLSILIELGMKFARTHVMDSVVNGLDSRLSREIFEQLLKLRVDQVPSSVGSLAAQIRGYEQVRSFYTASTLFTLIDLPLALILTAVIAVVASPWVALVPFLAALVAIGLGLSIRKKIMLAAREGATLSNLKTGLLVEAVEGMETIKSGTGGWKFLSRWIGVTEQTIESDRKTRGATESISYTSAAVQQVSYAALVVVGAFVVMQGQMTQGALIASSILGGRILAPVMALPGLLVQYAHAKAALESLERLYALKTDHEDTESPLTPESLQGHYQLKDIQFAYGDNPPALAVSQLVIHPGDRIAVLGPIGAGKSSLLRVLSGMYQPTQGRVLLDGLEISHIHRYVLNENIAYLQQDHRLFQGSLRENLLIGLPDPGDDTLIQAMRKTGMDRFVASHPKGLARIITEGGKGLSGGQKQLVAFTRLALFDPSIYLLDEPTATMDEEQEKQCLQFLNQAALKNKTMVIVTHKPSILPLVNRIIVITGNKIVMDGPRDLVMGQLRDQHAKAARRNRSEGTGQSSQEAMA
jgi:ATP-binding cassette subfamily C protein LapB